MNKNIRIDDLEFIINENPHIIIIINSDLKILYKNRTAKKLLTYNQRKAFKDILAYLINDVELSIKPDQCIEKNIIIFNELYKIKLIPYRGKKKILIYGEKLNQETYDNAIDNTSFKEQTSEDRFENLRYFIETFSYPVFIRDLSSTYRGCNKAFRDYFKTDITGKKISQVLSNKLTNIIMDQDIILLSNKIPQVTERSILKNSGIPINLRVYKDCILDNEGNVIGIIGSIIDIFEQKQLEDLLLIHKDLIIKLGSTSNLKDALAIILESCLQIDSLDSGGIYLIDDKTNNLVLKASIGLDKPYIDNVQFYTQDSPRVKVIMRGKPIYKIYEDLYSVLEPIETKEKLTLIAVLPIVLQNKVVGSINLASHIQKEISVVSKKTLELIASQLGGILARIKVEEEVKMSNINLESLFSTLDDYLFVIDMDGRILELNQSMISKLEYSKNRLLKMNIYELFPENSINEIKLQISNVLNGKQISFFLPLIKADQSTLPTETKLFKGFWSNSEAIFGIAHDLSEKQMAEMTINYAMEKSRELEFIINSSPVIAFSWIVDEDWILEYVSNNINIFGYSPKDLINSNFKQLALIHKDDKQRIIDEIDFYFKNEIKEFVQEYRIVTKNGDIKWVEDRNWISRDNKDNLIRCRGILRDITQRKRDENRISRLSRMYSFISEVNEAIVWSHNEHTLFNLISNIAIKLGLFKFVWIGKTDNDMKVYYPIEYFGEGSQFIDEIIQVFNDLEDNKCNLKLSINKGNYFVCNTLDNPHCSHKITRMKKSFTFSSLASFPLLVENVVVNIINFYSDEKDFFDEEEIKLLKKISMNISYALEVYINEEKCRAAEESLLQTSKIAALGEMSAGMIHELSQLISAIMLFAQGLEELVNSNNFNKMRFIEDLKLISHLAEKTSNVIQQLRTFARPEPKDYELVILNDVILNIIPIFQQQFKIKNINLSLKLNDNLPHIFGNNNQLEHVVTNILSNALDAMDKSKNKLITIKTFYNDKDVILHISDTGIGMAQETSRNIFIPFFSTKENNKGMGLGLSICYRIVKEHLGSIEAKSKLGEGTLFEIKFPILLNNNKQLN